MRNYENLAALLKLIRKRPSQYIGDGSFYELHILITGALLVLNPLRKEDSISSNIRGCFLDRFDIDKTGKFFHKNLKEPSTEEKISEFISELIEICQVENSL